MNFLDFILTKRALKWDGIEEGQVTCPLHCIGFELNGLQTVSHGFDLEKGLDQPRSNY